MRESPEEFLYVQIAVAIGWHGAFQQQRLSGRPTMHSASLVEFASQVLDVQGLNAEAEVARQKAVCERAGNYQVAKTWQRVAAEIAKLRRAELH
jgi:hypothetical protein